MTRLVQLVAVTAVAALAACGGGRASSTGIEDAGILDVDAGSLDVDAGSLDVDAGSLDVRGAVQADDATGDVATESLSGSEAGTCVSRTALGDASGDVSNGAPQPLEAGACINGWLTSDTGCPCSLSGFSAYCTSVGMKCFVPAPGPSYFTGAWMCVDTPSALMPLWEGTGIYAPDEFAALPNEIALDTSDCSSRPSLPCTCGTSGTTEGFLSLDPQLRQCTYGNPGAYVAFTDGGCASRIRYGASPVPDANYVSCLTSAYASRRWDCVSSGTHFVMSSSTGPPPLGGPP